MLTDNDINKLIADPECWDGRGLGARFDKVAFARKVEAMAMAAERERMADKCDDIADHADPNTCASLRDLAAELRA